MKYCVGIFLLFLVTASGTAFSQPTHPDHKLMVSEHTGVQTLTSIFQRGVHPVYVLSVTVPDTLRAGEEGLFSVQTNIETATLPVTGKWTFGDGAVVNGLTVRHAYSEPGEYSIEAAVANPGGKRLVKHTVVVVEPPDS